MSVPTDRNPRILVAEIATRIMTESSKVRGAGFRPTMSKEQIAEKIHSINSNIQQLKYSYLSDEELATSELLIEIAQKAEKIYESYKGAYLHPDGAGKQRKANVSERLLMGLPRRIKEPFRPTIESGIDMQVVGIRSIIPIEGTKLFVSKVFNGDEDFNVVTNLQTLKQGMKVGIAFLPAARHS